MKLLSKSSVYITNDNVIVHVIVVVCLTLKKHYLSMPLFDLNFKYLKF